MKLINLGKQKPFLYHLMTKRAFFYFSSHYLSLNNKGDLDPKNGFLLISLCKNMAPISAHLKFLPKVVAEFHMN